MPPASASYAGSAAPPHLIRPGSPAAFIYGCSPHPGGNTDFACRLLHAGLLARNISAECLMLRSCAFSPCAGCRACLEGKTGVGRPCIFSGKDGADSLFAPLLSPKHIFFVSPIYFYHLPALCKAFIDRGQAYWALRERGCPSLEKLPSRKAHVVLLAARKEGEKIFEGSLLSLQYFLKPFNIELAEPLLLRGLDGPGDLAENEAAQREISAYAQGVR